MKTTALTARSVKALLLTLFLASLAACGDPGPAPAKVPVAPSDVTATPGPRYITVTWRDNSNDETGFDIYRSALGGLSAQQAGTKIATVGANDTSYIDLDIGLEQEYRYSVAAVNAQGSSGETAATSAVGVPLHVDLMMGTGRRRSTDEWAGTIAVIYLVLPLDVLDANVVNVRIDGPAGWNDGQPLVSDHACPAETDTCYEAGFLFRTYGSLPVAVTGDYDLTVTVAGEVYTATAYLDASFRFGKPTGFEISGVNAGGAIVEWTSPADTESVAVSLHRGTYAGMVSGYRLITEERYIFEGLELEDGAYGIEIAPMNADVVHYPIKVDRFGLSYDYVPFYVGDISPACSAHDQVVAVPDAALRQAIVNALSLPGDTLTCGDMARLTELWATNFGIASLEGLQYALNLSMLGLSWNEITDLSQLAPLDKLELIDLNVNDVSDMEPLRGHTNLKSLHVCCTTTANITDASALATLTGMEMINLGFHELGDTVIWPLLENYPNLTGLWVAGNHLTEFEHLFDYPRLTALDVGWHDLPNLAFLDVMDDLWRLELGGANIADASALFTKTSVGHLVLSETGLSDIGFLEAFTELVHLELRGNAITDLAPLVANAGLGSGDYVDVTDNPLDPTDPVIADQIEALLGRGVDLRY